MTQIDRTTEARAWEIGPEKFARRGHARCTNLGSRESTGIAYVYMATGADGFVDNAMQLCTCVTARIARHGLTPIVRRIGRAAK
jgi:hypothetical protein